jgi:hypothetical protein
MTELLGKDKDITCFIEHEANFQELEKWLTTTQVLVMSNMEKPFSIYHNVVEQGLGSIKCMLALIKRQFYAPAYQVNV